ncbi:MAG: tRNA (5-methylaminomethyl-2-thiouridine)(34)-methyltransferase MnmD [Gammaproteobacteria bacterium]|nr:tRNA (5-methylaminomethyl-2-thiouridine)(34)-methyltransferase MnmD [Gammaproteobacteria bacterium]
MPNSPTKAAQLVWDEQNHPYSSQFNDHYYSLVDGIEETRHVFIEGNDLAERWREMKSYQSFKIMETGFGSGLNFLSTWQLWKRLGMEKTNKLHFVSIEAFPMDVVQLKKSMLNWQSQLSMFSSQLLEKYPKLDKGTHTINFEDDNVVLTLIFGDVRAVMPELNFSIDDSVNAWFLDGFSPSKNPEMWQNDLYTEMYRLSAPLASVATYTVAGLVRRGLVSTGFQIDRRPGFGTKRDMLTASKISR